MYRSIFRINITSATALHWSTWAHSTTMPTESTATLIALAIEQICEHSKFENYA